MKYRSTRHKSKEVSASEAIQMGLAPDGGLFVPVDFPKFDINEFSKDKTLSEVASRALAPFFEGDPLQTELGNICKEALYFETPLNP